jgi:hypothetical protein
MKPWLKAGLIGAGVLVVLNLMNLIPAVACFCCLLWPVVYAAVGALAASFMPPVRDSGSAAGQGALAALIAQLAGGIVMTIISAIQGATQGAAQVLPPEMIQQWESAGLDPTVLQDTFNSLSGPTGGILSGSICCGGGLIVAAILGALGGLIFASIKRE